MYKNRITFYTYDIKQAHALQENYLNVLSWCTISDQDKHENCISHISDMKEYGEFCYFSVQWLTGKSIEDELKYIQEKYGVKYFCMALNLDTNKYETYGEYLMNTPYAYFIEHEFPSYKKRMYYTEEHFHTFAGVIRYFEKLFNCKLKSTTVDDLKRELLDYIPEDQYNYLSITQAQ